MRNKQWVYHEKLCPAGKIVENDSPMTKGKFGWVNSPKAFWEKYLESVAPGPKPLPEPEPKVSDDVSDIELVEVTPIKSKPTQRSRKRSI
mgnify:CR=1 FL=1